MESTPLQTDSFVKHFLQWVAPSVLFMEQLDSIIINTAVPSMAASLRFIHKLLGALVQLVKIGKLGLSKAA